MIVISVLVMQALMILGLSLQLRSKDKAQATERSEWVAERRLLTAAAMQPVNPTGAARLQRREPAEPAEPRPTPIGL